MSLLEVSDWLELLQNRLDHRCGVTSRSVEHHALWSRFFARKELDDRLQAAELPVEWAKAEFATLRLGLLKVGARVVKTTHPASAFPSPPPAPRRR